MDDTQYLPRQSAPLRAAKVPNSTIVAYAMPWFILQMTNLPIVNFVPGFYASDLGIPLLQISLIVIAARAFDIFTDPLIGTLSDRTQTPFGRRKPWIACGIPVLALGAWLLLLPDENADAVYLLISLGIAYLGFTMLQIPLAAWGADLSADYDERSRIVGIREIIGIFGTLAAISSPLLAQILVGGGLREALGGLFFAIVILAPLLSIPLLFFLREPTTRVSNQVRVGFLEGVRLVARNKTFLIFGTGIMMVFVGMSPYAALSYILFKDVLDAEDIYAYSVIGTFVAALLSLPIWVRLCETLGKHRVVASGLILSVCVHLPLPLVVALEMDPIFAVIHATLLGIGLGALITVPYAMIADIIDEDTILSGQQRSGLYMAFAGMILKTALMLGAAIGLAWPALFDFEAGAPDNSQWAQLQVAIGAAWITVVLYSVAAILFWHYPLTRERQLTLRERLG